MKVLTVYQPRASLVALGVKPIETRSWSTTYRGPLAIHSAKMEPPSADGVYGDWIYQRATRCLRHVDGRLVHYVPRGAIVATCELVDVAPIGGAEWWRSGVVEGDEGDLPGRPVVVRHEAFGTLPERLILDHEGRQSDITDQLPYGDFSPGRFAWLLADIEPVDPPVPFRGGQCLTREWTP